MATAFRYLNTSINEPLGLGLGLRQNIEPDEAAHFQ